MGWLKNRLVIPLILAMLMVSYAEASVHIEYVTPAKIAFQPNDLGEVYVRVNNGGGADEYLFVDYDVDGAKYRDFWHIGPKGARTFTLYFQAPPEEGIYDVNIHAYNKWNDANVKFEIIVAPVDFNFVVDLDPEYISVDAGETVELSLGVANVGTKTDVYGIVVGEDVKIGTNVIELKGSNITHIPLEIVTSEIDPIGGKIFDVKVCSLTDLSDLKCKTTRSTVVLVKPEFLQSLVAIENDEIFTFSDSASFSMQITNLGIQEKTYLLEVHPDENTTAIPEPETFSLGPGETQDVKIHTVNTGEGIHQVDYELFANGVKISSNPLYVMVSSAGITGAFIATLTSPWFYGIIALIVISIVVIYFLLWPKAKEYPYGTR